MVTGSSPVAGTRILSPLQRIDGKLQLVEPKSARSRRTITLPDVVRDALRKHRLRQAEQRLATGSDWEESDFVFTRSLGGPLNDSNVTHMFQRHLASAVLRASASMTCVTPAPRCCSLKV